MSEAVVIGAGIAIAAAGAGYTAYEAHKNKPKVPEIPSAPSGIKGKAPDLAALQTQQKQRLAAYSGTKSTILTSPLGTVGSGADGPRKTLLGS